MRLHVIGVGSIGSLISHHLRHSTRLPISLISRGRNRFQKLPINRDDPDGPKKPLITIERGGEKYHSSRFEVEQLHSGSTYFPSSPRNLNPGGTYKDLPNESIDSLIVCLKTQYTINQLKVLAPRLSSTSVVTLIQNGMGVYDELCDKVFTDPIERPNFIIGTTTHGVSRTGTYGHVRHMTKFGEGEIKFGVVPDPRKRTDFESWLWKDPKLNHNDSSGSSGRGASSSLFSSSSSSAGDLPILTPPESLALPLPSPPDQSLNNLHTTLEALLSMRELNPSLLPMPHLHHQLLLKLAINSAINPLTAILGLGSLPNGALLDGKVGYRLLVQVCMETSQILTAYLRSLSHPYEPSSDVMAMFSVDSLVRRTRHIIRQTSNNRSSMAQDVLSSFKLTEIEYINGYLVKLARRLNVPCPVNHMLVDMVKFICDTAELDTKVPDRLSNNIKQKQKILAERVDEEKKAEGMVRPLTERSEEEKTLFKEMVAELKDAKFAKRQERRRLKELGLTPKQERPSTVKEEAPTRSEDSRVSALDPESIVDHSSSRITTEEHPPSSPPSSDTMLSTSQTSSPSTSSTSAPFITTPCPASTSKSDQT